MTYKNISDLPKKVRDHLNNIDQEIYLNAFNNAWREYKNLKELTHTVSRKQTADRMAANAVRRHHLQQYLKDVIH